MDNIQRATKKLKQDRAYREHAVEYFMAKGYDRETAEKYAGRHITGKNIAGGISRFVGGVAKYGGMAAKGLDNHFREQYGMPHPKHGHSKKSRKNSGSPLGGDGMFHSNLMDSNL
jgi:hypothetical protein